MRVGAVVRLDRSLPAFGSLKSWHQSSPRVRIFGSQCGLLLGRATGEDRRPDQVHADATDELRRTGAGQLLGDDVVADGPRVAPAVLLGQATPTQPADGEPGLPLPAERDLVGEIVEAGREALAVLPGQVLAQPCPALVAQRGFGLGR